VNEVPDDVVRMRELLRDRAVAGGGDPVAPERLMRLLDGELSPEEAKALADRIAGEPELALELRITAALREQRDAEAANAPAPATARSRRPLWTALGAVAAALAVFWLTRPPQLDPVESTEIRAAALDPSLRPVASGGSLPRDAFELKWTGGPLGATFEVFVTTPDLVSVYRAYDLSSPRVVVPARALQAQPSGARLLWRVIAVSPNGRRASSAAFEVTVR
jgi:hypothetical protein